MRANRAAAIEDQVIRAVSRHDRDEHGRVAQPRFGPPVARGRVQRGGHGKVVEFHGACQS